MLFLERFLTRCDQSPDEVALEFVGPGGGQVVSYADLAALVERAAAALVGMGVRVGDRVAIQLPKGLPFIVLHLAAMRLGAISLPLNPAFPPAELHYFLEDAGAPLLFTSPVLAAALERLAPLPALRRIIPLSPETPLPLDDAALSLPPPPADPNQTALMIYTSGTTGRPKGAEITHGNLSANLDALHEAWGWRPDDLLLHVLPIFHIHGLVVALHGALHAGSTALLLPRFEARQTLETLVARRCTLLMGVPTIHWRLMALPEAAQVDLGHMRLVTSGSDRLPDADFARFRDLFGHTLLERYGMSETGMNLSNPLHGERRPGSVGLPLPGVEARIVESEAGAPLPDGRIGEVQIRGPHVFKGYWGQPEKTADAFTPDGWFRTGDLGARAADGYYTLHGRAKDLIISGGFNVYPPEVERVLAAHPDVEGCAVIGCPDPDLGERVVAVVVPRPDARPDEAALLAHCRAHLAPYKCPRRITLTPTLPRNAMGKVQKALLREAHCGTGRR